MSTQKLLATKSMPLHFLHKLAVDCSPQDFLKLNRGYKACHWNSWWLKVSILAEFIYPEFRVSAEIYKKKRKSLEFILTNKNQKDYAYVWTNSILSDVIFQEHERKLMFSFLLSRWKMENEVPKGDWASSRLSPWIFIGFILEAVTLCSEKGELENIIFSHANVADCKIAEKLCECVEWTVFADVGYLLKKEILKRMENNGIGFEAATRKNKNRPLSSFECYYIKHRSIIESDWETLKNNFCLEYHKARCTVRIFRHFF